MTQTVWLPFNWTTI